MSKVVHFEFAVQEPSKVMDFFTKTFGWQFQQWGEDEYYLTAAGEEGAMGIGGAIMKANPGQPQVTTTIGVASIDDTLESVIANGGEIALPKQPVGDMGFIAYFKDPEGTIHGLWELVQQG